MRLALLALVLVFSVTAGAAPKIGDKIHRRGFYSSGGKTGGVSIDQETISFDATANKFLVRSTVTVDGSAPQVTDNLVDSSQMTTREQVLGYVTGCATMGGTRQNLAVLGSVYDACVLSFDNGKCKGTTTIADVPFGILATDVACPADGVDRLVLPSSAATGGELSFSWGN